MGLPGVKPNTVHLPDFSHPSQATIISHLDFCNNLLTALPTLIPLTVHHPPYSQNNLCKTQIRLGIKIFVYISHWEDTEILALDYRVLHDTASVTVSTHTSCHSLQSPARLPKSWTSKVIPTSPSKPSFSPFSLLNSSLFFHCLIFMARFPHHRGLSSNVPSPEMSQFTILSELITPLYPQVLRCEHVHACVCIDMHAYSESPIFQNCCVYVHYVFHS